MKLHTCILQASSTQQLTFCVANVLESQANILDTCSTIYHVPYVPRTCTV